MMLDEALRAVVRSEMQNVLREELRAQLVAAVQAPRAQRADAGEGLLSIAQAAAYAGVHARTIRGWVSAGRLRRATSSTYTPPCLGRCSARSKASWRRDWATPTRRRRLRQRPDLPGRSVT